jgi:dolichol-phosphate mannosyltransferase
MMPKISVIIPVKDEPYLPHLVRRIKQMFPCDVHIQTEPGLANAVLCGVKVASGDVVCVLDADGSHNPSYLPTMVHRLSEADIVVGSRYVRGGGTEDYFMRMLLSRLFCKLSRALLRLKVNDNMSGFVVAKREVFEQMHPQPFGYKFVLELLVKGRGRFTVVEHPVVFEKRKMGISKTGFGQGVKTFMFILKLWIGDIVK